MYVIFYLFNCFPKSIYRSAIQNLFFPFKSFSQNFVCVSCFPCAVLSLLFKLKPSCLKFEAASEYQVKVTNCESHHTIFS